MVEIKINLFSGLSSIEEKKLVFDKLKKALLITMIIYLLFYFFKLSAGIDYFGNFYYEIWLPDLPHIAFFQSLLLIAVYGQTRVPGTAVKILLGFFLIITILGIFRECLIMIRTVNWDWYDDVGMPHYMSFLGSFMSAFMLILINFSAIKSKPIFDAEKMENLIVLLMGALIAIFLVLTISDYYWKQESWILIIDLIILLIYWFCLMNLYIYRFEINPWKSGTEIFETEKREIKKEIGITSFAAEKLKDAKELLDKGVITEEEFQEMKKEYLE